MGVKVSVGGKVWVMVAGWVEEGSGLIVQVGGGEGNDWGANVNPPHPINNRAVVEIEIKIFRKWL
jgi:hypothetical protein